LAVVQRTAAPVGQDAGLVLVEPLLERIGDFAAFLAEGEEAAVRSALRAAETTGRPLGNDAFIAGLERKIARGRPGPKPGSSADAQQPCLWG
jgi:putative transposase